MCFEASVLMQNLYLLFRMCFLSLFLMLSLSLFFSFSFKFEVDFAPQQLLLGLLRKLHCTHTSDNNKKLTCLGCPALSWWIAWL